MASNCLKVQKSVEKADSNCIDATIRIRQESWCLPYAGFFEGCMGVSIENLTNWWEEEKSFNMYNPYKKNSMMPIEMWKKGKLSSFCWYKKNNISNF